MERIERAVSLLPGTYPGIDQDVDLILIVWSFAGEAHEDERMFGKHEVASSNLVSGTMRAWPSD